MDTLNQMLSQLNKQDIIMLTFGKAVGDIQKAKIRPVQDAFQLEKIIDNKAFHENMDFEQLKDNVYMLLDKYFMQAVIYTKSDDIHIFKNRKAELSIKKHKATKIKRDSAHDRKKLRIIEDGVQAPFLIDLGICDKEGRVLDKNSKKFIQISAFLHILDNAVSKLNFNNRKVKIVDYCCGKAYLTFAVHYYFQNIKKSPLVS